eukprot:8402065-Alexandrium_andersonii.AAC.1
MAGNGMHITTFSAWLLYVLMNSARREQPNLQPPLHICSSQEEEEQDLSQMLEEVLDDVMGTHSGAPAEAEGQRSDSDGEALFGEQGAADAQLESESD